MIFTVCFVIVGCIIIGGGYVIIQSGILSPGPSATATPTVTVTPVPIFVSAGPTEIPSPTAPIILPPISTPTPTPVPARYALGVSYLGDTSSRTYTVSYTLGKNSVGTTSDPIDMGLALLSVWEGAVIYQNYTLSEILLSGGGWSGADGDNMLESGETFIFKVNGYTLGISPDAQSHVTFVLGGEVIKTTTLPYLINPVESTQEVVDPRATFNPYA